jgi:tRNA threonylcarbamoyladenosine biosynthesis protein TsaE
MAQGFHEISRGGLKALALRVIDEFLKKETKNKAASIVILSGNLGSGKTTFVQVLVKALGVYEKVLSPTFVFLHEHRISETKNKKQKTKRAFKKLIHIDAYRIDSKRDFESLNIKSYLSEKNNLVFIEWGEKIKKWLPKPDMKIEFRHRHPTLRKVRITKFDGKK